MTKDRHLRIAALLVVWTIMVYLVGPIVTAMVRAENFRASLARMDEQSRPNARYKAAQRLLDLYDERNPPPIVLAQIELDYCGYDWRLDDHAREGMSYLFEASLLSDRRIQSQHRLDRFTPSLSDFGLIFLGNCMSSTVLAHACENYLGSVLARTGTRDARDLPSASPDGDEHLVQEHVNCRYLDGVAARAGMALAKAQAAGRSPGN